MPLGKLGRKIRNAALYFSVPGRIRAMMARVQERRLTYLPRSKLIALVRLCLASDKADRPGVIVEAGCALGGSGILLASTKSKGRQLRIYDVFGMIPPPSEKDGVDVHSRYEVIKKGESAGLGGDPYYGYESSLYEKVMANFASLGYAVEENNVSLIKGLLQETLIDADPVILAHVDVDWHDPVKTCAERIWPRLVMGGAIVFDDYADYSGCKKAVDDYFAAQAAGTYQFDGSAGSMIVRKVG